MVAKLQIFPYIFFIFLIDFIYSFNCFFEILGAVVVVFPKLSLISRIVMGFKLSSLSENTHHDVDLHQYP